MNYLNEKLQCIEKILANIMCDIDDQNVYLDLSEVLQIIDEILVQSTQTEVTK